MLGQITILTKILKNFYPPRPLFNVGTQLVQVMVAVHIQTLTQTLNWGGGERTACNVKPHVFQLLLKLIVSAVDLILKLSLYFNNIFLTT